MAAGAALGAIALTARHAPALRKPPIRHVSAPVRASAPDPEPPPTSAPVTSVSASASAPLPTMPVPRSARFDADPRARGACPEDMALVEGDFCPALRYDCIRQTGAVGCAEYARGNRCAEPTDHRRYCVDRYEWPNVVGENPTVYVDWYEAKALCGSVGKRLCRRSEWILACEGPKRLPFPWGWVRRPSPCNMARAAFAFDFGAMIKEETREGELARLWQADRIGAHPDCVSAFGAYDLSGNVDEWTDDQADN